MNDAARERLIEAALNDIPQAKGDYHKLVRKDGKTRSSYCALGWLGYYDGITSKQQTDLDINYGILQDTWMECPLCYARSFSRETFLIAHLNDYHELDFLTIARKL